MTASKYPFPTVCADKQSTDWFHAISRTLKWNEREKQKSFVVVEEGPVKRRKSARRKEGGEGEVQEGVKGPSQSQSQNGDAGVGVGVGVGVSASAATATDTKPPKEVENENENDDNEEAIEDEEEDEVSEEEEEEEKFDIDDSAAHNPSEEMVAQQKALEQLRRSESSLSGLGSTSTLGSSASFGFTPIGSGTGNEGSTARDAAIALSRGNPYLNNRSSSRTRAGAGGGDGGIETPDRFAGPHPHPPRVSPRHVAFATPSADTHSHHHHHHHPSHTHTLTHTHTHTTTATSTPSSLSPTSSTDSFVLTHEAHKGDRDHIRSPENEAILNGARSRIPRDRDLEGGHEEDEDEGVIVGGGGGAGPSGAGTVGMNLKTPTAPSMNLGSAAVSVSGSYYGYGGQQQVGNGFGNGYHPHQHSHQHPHPHQHHRHISRDLNESVVGTRRAFAKWGHDESDSNASDSDL